MVRNTVFLLFISLFTLSSYGAGVKNVELSRSCKTAFHKSSENIKAQNKLNEIMDFLPKSVKEFRTSRYRDQSPKDLFEFVVKNRVKQINELTELRNLEEMNEVQKDLLKVSILKLENDLEVNLTHIENKLKLVPEARSWEELVQLGNEPKARAANALLSNIRSFFLESRAVLTETLIALQSKNVNATEMHVEQIVEKQWPKVFSKEENSQTYKSAKDLEMDVVANDFKEWIEVKSYNNKNKKFATRLLDTLTKKTIRVKKLTDKLYSEYGIEIQFHIVIVGNGSLPKNLKEKLEGLGAILHMQKLSSESFLK